MSEKQKLKEWYESVLLATGWSAAKWAEEAGTSPTNITRLMKDPESSSMPSLPTLRKLLDAVPVHCRSSAPSYLLGDFAFERHLRIKENDLDQTEARLLSDMKWRTPNDSVPISMSLEEPAPSFLPIPAPQPRDVIRIIPVLGSGRGGSDDEGVFELNGSEVNRVKCPPALTDVRGAYALYVQGTSMEPRYFEGEIVYINPIQPPRINDFVVIQFTPRHDGDNTRAIIKRLVGRTASVLKVEQYNPPKTYDVPRSDIKAVHRIISGGEEI